jgi:hypothetical protein
MNPNNFQNIFVFQWFLVQFEHNLMDGGSEIEAIYVNMD